MSGFGFGALAIVTVAGLAGPLLASVPGLRIPVVIGELAIGLVIGRTGFGVVDSGDRTFELLANIGFALVMFVVGTHVPIRDTTLRSSIPGAAGRAVLVGVAAAILGRRWPRSSRPGTPRSTRCSWRRPRRRWRCP